MDLPVKSIKKIYRGFTLFEIIVVIGIIGLLITVSTSVYSSFRAHESLEITTIGVVEALRYAQANAQSGKGDSGWGVAILSSSVVVFKGTNYINRDTSADQTLDFYGGVTADGLSEIVFSKVTGSTEDVGAVILTNSYGTKNIEINEKGILTY